MGWTLRVVAGLRQASETRQRLAVAEERLRIARDLHDEFGRTLAAIAVKSELAAVRRLADDAATEARHVVRGELPIDCWGSRTTST